MTTADNDSDDGAQSDTRSELVQLASYYDTHALRHRSASKRWFVAIVVVAIVGIGAGADSEYFVRDAASDVSLGQSLVLASANLVQIAMLSILLYWTIQRYRWNKSQELDSERRRVALHVVESLICAAADETIKETLLLRCAESVLESQMDAPAKPGART